MDFTQIFYTALGIVVTGLTSFLVAKITEWINSKIKDQKAASYLLTITNLVFSCVQEIYQTYVEVLKKENKFDADAQKQALDTCLTKIKSQMAPEIASYITANFGDLDSYLTSQIESTIYSLKFNK